jgi:hypothetical protein
MHLGLVDRQHRNAGKPGPRAQRQDLAEQPGQRGFVTLRRCVDGAELFGV